MPAALGDDLDSVLAEVARRDDCVLLAPAGQAQVPAGMLIPPDLRRFHDRCGGAILLTGTDFTWHVSGPDRLVPASPRMFTPQIAQRVAAEYPDDLTNTCYVIADGGRESSTDANIVIDLHPDRLGRCYLVFWDTYGVAGEMFIVALTMAELLREVIDLEGRMTASQAAYGDAYEPELPWQPAR